MCGLFGVHKDHKITTDSELKDFNANLITNNSEKLKDLLHMKTIRKNNSFEEYIEAKTRECVKGYKKGITEVTDVG